ncbi:hypothetical protein FRX31_015160 [Thalictrum thalictroides]|uniref:B3 domain-containing protein n=1 Tax=Thalictrum thalictroides TaxID=46969 RepID=A0A7J6WE65_THATH|nr:hypothetical protein FRX31_015160 [Thalictrum thalictroides]
MYYSKSAQEPLQSFNFAVSCQSSKLVSTALHDANMKHQDGIIPFGQSIEASAEVESSGKSVAKRSHVLLYNWTSGFVHRRNLEKGDEIAMCWDQRYSSFSFRVLN